MHVYVRQANFTTKPRFETANLHSFKLIVFQGSRFKKNTQVQMKRILFTNEAWCEICSCDVNMHKGY